MFLLLPALASRKISIATVWSRDVRPPAYEYIVSAGPSYTINYPPATTDQAKATLTHRVHLDDVPHVVPVTGWAYNAAGTAINLLPPGTPFIAGDIYEFSAAYSRRVTSRIAERPIPRRR